MFLGIIEFHYNKYDPFGILGFIVIIIYFIFVFKYRKKEKNSFWFSIIVFIYYFLIIISKAIENDVGFFFLNILWVIPFTLCILVDGTIFMIKIFKEKKMNKQKRKQKRK